MRRVAVDYTRQGMAGAGAAKVLGRSYGTSAL